MRKHGRKIQVEKCIRQLTGIYGLPKTFGLLSFARPFHLLRIFVFFGVTHGGVATSQTFAGAAMTSQCLVVCLTVIDLRGRLNIESHWFQEQLVIETPW